MKNKKLKKIKIPIILEILLVVSTIIITSHAAVAEDQPILANPELFRVELYENFSRFEGVPLAFYMTITGGESGFPAGLYVTSGPLPGTVEIPPGSGNFVRASDRLFYLNGSFSATEMVTGFNSTETIVFARGAYGDGMFITEPRENRIQRVRLINGKPEVTVFSPSAGTTPFGPAALAYDNIGNLFMTDAAGGRILRVSPNGTTEFFANVPLPQVPAGAFIVVKPITYDFSNRYGGSFITGTYSGSQALEELPPLDTIYSVSRDGTNVTKLLNDSYRLRRMEFLTLGPGGAFGSDLYVSSLGNGTHGDGGVYTMSPNGTLTPFITGIDPSHVVFDTQGILGGGMFVADFNQQNTGYADGPPRIWKVTPLPPPVGKNIGFYDTSIYHLVTNTTDQNACRQCHQTSGTNISGGYNNTVGGVPTRHHTLVQRGILNPLTNTPFGCTDCHPTSASLPNGMLLDRSCQDCHNRTAFWGNSIGGHVGNISVPHHVNASYASSNIGNPAENRTCNFCHGSFVDNYNDGHYKPSYATDFMITPYATFKVTNFSQQTALGGNRTYGGCNSCHLANPAATLQILNNDETHHLAGIPNPSSYAWSICGKYASSNYSLYWKCFIDIDYGNISARCKWCHLYGSPDLLLSNTTNPFTGEILINAMEVRNSTIEQEDAAINAFEPGTTNITINGTGCEKCHSVKSLHNIQYQYQQNGPQGLGHINNDWDCSGCHNSWLPANDFVPNAIIPYVDEINPSVIVAETATTLTITGSNFVNGQYTSVVSIDGATYIPTSITDSQIMVNIPALTAGTHQLQLVKGGDTLSKLSILTVVPNPTITSAKLNSKSGIITITGTGFGTKPATDSQLYVSVNHTGNQIASTNVQTWSNNQIKVKNSAATIGDVVTVMTANSGEVQAIITG